jgi:MipA family protein
MALTAISLFRNSALAIMLASSFSNSSEARDWRLTIGPLVEYRSDYPGASNRSTSPSVFVEVHDANTRARPETADASRIDWIEEDSYALGFAFNVRAERKQSDLRKAGLSGVAEVDTTVELGAFAMRRFGMLELGIDLLKGVNGHKGFLLSPELAYESDNEASVRWRVAAVANYGNARYNDAYFSTRGARFNGVTIPDFAAGSGLRDIGLRGTVISDLSERWSWVARASVQRYVGDAKNSTLVALGRDTDASVGLGIAYTF